MRLISIQYGEKGMAPAAEVLSSGGSALDAIEAGMRVVEPDPSVETVGRGGAPNAMGESECDAAVMDGETLNTGSVGGVKGHVYAFSIARAVMEKLPHVMLVGEGANRFAREIGAEWYDDMVPEYVQEKYQAWKREKFPEIDGPLQEDTPLIPAFSSTDRVFGRLDTVIYLAIDQCNHIVAGTSTSGWSHKYPGRLGDSPIIGAGLYAHNQYGGCCCTHTGEMTIRANTAASVVRYMKKGASVHDACEEAIDDLRELKGGIRGPVVIYAVSSSGEYRVVTTLSKDEEFYYCYWDETLEAPERRTPAYSTL